MQGQPCRSQLTCDFRFHFEIVVPEEDALAFRIAPGEQPHMLEAGKTWKRDPKVLLGNHSDASGVAEPVGDYEPHAAGQQGEQYQDETEQAHEAHLCK